MHQSQSIEQKGFNIKLSACRVNHLTEDITTVVLLVWLLFKNKWKRSYKKSLQDQHLHQVLVSRFIFNLQNITRIRQNKKRKDSPVGQFVKPNTLLFYYESLGKNNIHIFFDLIGEQSLFCKLGTVWDCFPLTSITIHGNI